MALIISRRPNGGYNGQHKAEAARLVKSGTRVGMCHVGSDQNHFYCHICKTNQPYPVDVTQPKVDEMAPCPGCQTPFVFATFGV